ncbi:zinc finger protein-domain-containing protein [Apiospora arundinis]
MAPAKFSTAAMQHRVNPHMMTLKAEYLARAVVARGGSSGIPRKGNQNRTWIRSKSSPGLDSKHSHDRGVRDSCLVEVVQPIDDAEQRHQIEVDLAQQLLLLFRGDDDSLALVADKDLVGLVGIILVGVLEHRAGLDIGLWVRR